MSYNRGPMSDEAIKTEIKLATTWFLAARTMAVADGNVPKVKEAAAGLYARAILEVSEQVCVLVVPHPASSLVAYHHQSCQPCRNERRNVEAWNALS